ncbi:hypothetical protein DSO57_1001715 [Entomophthora muscae]|uniref:Uncharacterized protein n=1 Tax=Entomophthora muscae TaxID=34485 RepID=A0ACC2SLL3_9FUNG|nr:hypothetical protein DSO57_1001715 [Entomophthora muscae]
MKNISSLEVWHKHLKMKFGSTPKYKKYFQKLKEEQAVTIKVPVNSTNQRAGLAIEPKTNWASMEEEIEKLPNKHRPPRDDQPSDPTRKFEYSQSEPANEITPVMDATKDWKNLETITPRPEKFVKDFP